MAADRRILGLSVCFVVTLWLVYGLGNAVLWVLWGAVMMALSGGLLVRLNRR
ncbi:hypothetical protein [Natronosalvus rutilus]|uniref:Uncharacterized protein n=1 Tax=Natronosalvus rutilus TaxID=2953753 RepID=A0A9E7SWP9_9EURY|nr:hypothetical protein [Natronosalvus rutilus]UTF53368.1 hypothetical protein NGM29_16600 [Natronosalvus rutilus]